MTNSSMQKTEVFLKKIQNLILKKKFKHAIKVCDELLKIDKQNFHANANKANLLAEIGFYDKSIPYYYKALQTAPNDHSVLFNLATTLYDLDRYDEAIRLFDKVIKMQPRNIDAICNKANALVALGKHTQAISFYNRALNVFPEDIVILNNKGNCFCRKIKAQRCNKML